MRQGVDEQPTDVKHRKYVQIHVAATEIVDHGIQAVPGDLAMTDLGALGQTGGAAGEDDGGDVFIPQIFAETGIGRRVGQQCVEIPATGNAGTVQVNPVAHRSFGFGQLGNAFPKSVVVKQHGRGDIGENLLQLAPVQAPVQGGMNRAQLAAGAQQIQMLDPVQCQHRHPVALVDAGRAQSVG